MSVVGVCAADRLNQLPIGVIGIAVGTVLLPEMSRRLAAGDERGAAGAQRQAFETALVLTVPCLIAFLLLPDLIMRALFARGAFTAAFFLQCMEAIGVSHRSSKRRLGGR